MRGPWSIRRYRQKPLKGGGRAWLAALLVHAVVLGLPLALVSPPAKPPQERVLHIEPPPPPRPAGTAAPEPRPLEGVGEPKAPPRKVGMVQPSPPPPPQPPLVQPEHPAPPEAEPPPPPLPEEPPLPEVKPPAPPPQPVEPERPSPRRVRRPEPEETRQPQPPKPPTPREDATPRPDTQPPPQPEPDPYAYIEKFYVPPKSPAPLPEPAPPGNAASLDDLFNRGGGTPGAARILPLGGSDSYSFRARQEAFASIGLLLREFVSDRRLYNSSSGMIQGVRTAQGIKGLAPSVAPGRVIQIGLVDKTQNGLVEVDHRMTEMETAYLRDNGLLGKVEVQQVEYKVILGAKGYELAIGNIAYRNKDGGGS